MNDELLQALGINPQQAREEAMTRGLLGSIFQAAALSGPQSRPVSTAQALGQVGLSGMGAYESSFDKTLKEALTGLQVRDLIRKQQETQQLRTLLPQVFQTTRTPATQEEIVSEQGTDYLTRPGAVTGVKIDPTKLQALMMVPGGMEAVKGMAETQKLLRQSGLAGGAEAPSPFSPYLNAQNPEVKKLAQTYEQGYKSGVIDEETAYKRIEPLARMEQSFIDKQPGARQGLTDEMNIRTAFKAEPVYKAHQEMQSAYGQITESLRKGTPAGDLAGATKFMKLLDPGSVVRESELYLAMKASGALDRMVNYANMKLTGQSLTETQRKDFQELADKLYGASVDAYNTKRNEYAGLAVSYGLNPERSVGAIAKFSISERPETPAAKAKPSVNLRSILFPNSKGGQ